MDTTETYASFNLISVLVSEHSRKTMNGTDGRTILYYPHTLYLRIMVSEKKVYKDCVFDT